MRRDYIHACMRELRDQQSRFAPRDKKLMQIDRAEALVAEIDPEKSYPYDYICFRVTGFRPDNPMDISLPGEEASHDLLLFIEDLSDSAEIDASSVRDDVWTVDQLSQHLNISRKTISRWRKKGLVGRRFVIGGRKRLGFLSRSVQRFVERHSDRVDRSVRFHLLTESERDTIISRARRLARTGASPKTVARRVADRLGRSEETIRYTIREFDRMHPEVAIFDKQEARLGKESRSEIARRHAAGESVATLAKEFGRTRSAIYRIIAVERAERIMDLPLDHMYNPEFDVILDSGNEEDIVGLAPVGHPPSKPSGRVPGDLPPYLAELYDIPLLTREQEVHLFRKMNYLKFKASRLREGLDVHDPKSALMDEIERCTSEAKKTKNKIVAANLRLVVSIAKRHVSPSENFFELVSDGNISLMQAVEKFDYARGNKFSTYASWAIMKNYARSIPNERKQQERFRTTPSEIFESSTDDRADPYVQESVQLQWETQIGQMLKQLDDREQRIIVSRFGLERGHEPKTLRQVGAQMGVTKERIRQIEARALDKLRRAVREEKLEIPGLE